MSCLSLHVICFFGKPFSFDLIVATVPQGTSINDDSPCFPVFELFSPLVPFIAAIFRLLMCLKSEKAREHFKNTSPPFPPFPPELILFLSLEKLVTPSPPDPLLIIIFFFMSCIRNNNILVYLCGFLFLSPSRFLLISVPVLWFFCVYFVGRVCVFFVSGRFHFLLFLVDISTKDIGLSTFWR